MKLLEKPQWYARVSGTVKCIKKDTTGTAMHFPLNVGGIYLKSKDGQRDFVLDPYQTEYTIAENGDIEFQCRLESVPEEFEDYKFDLLVEDIREARAEFFNPVDDAGDGVYHDDTGEFTIEFYFQKEPSIQIRAFQEDSSDFRRLMTVRRAWTLQDYTEAYGDGEWETIPATAEECWERMDEHIAQTYDEGLIKNCLEDEW